MKFSYYNITIHEDEDKYILINTLTGAMFRIDEDVKKRIENGEITSFSEKEIEDYKESGILISDEVDERKYLDYMFQKSKFTTDVLSITVLLTDLCNLRCVYCYEGAGEYRKDTLNNYTREKISKFIKRQIEISNARIISLVLFGGEPLLYFKDNIEWLNDIKEYCVKNGKEFQTSIVTNGILLTDLILDELIKLNCNYIQITLDGIPEIHDKRRIYKNGKGSFDEVLKGIKLVHSREDISNPMIRINVDKENYKETFRLLEYLKDEGLNDCGIDFGIVKGGTEACAAYVSHCFADTEIGEILEPLWKKLDELGYQVNTNPTRKSAYCGLYNDNAFTISPTGDVYKCWEFVGDDKHRIGRIDEDGNLVDIGYTYFDWMSFDPLKIEECRECKYLPTCGGGCGAVSYEKNKNYHSSGCFKIKGVFEKQIIRKLCR